LPFEEVLSEITSLEKSLCQSFLFTFGRALTQLSADLVIFQ